MLVTNKRRMGASLCWKDQFFTMDEQRSKYVTKAFVSLYNQGLIYRDIKLVNWCFALESVISDIEIDYITIEKPSYIKIPQSEKP